MKLDNYNPIKSPTITKPAKSKKVKCSHCKHEILILDIVSEDIICYICTNRISILDNLIKENEEEDIKYNYSYTISSKSRLFKDAKNRLYNFAYKKNDLYNYSCKYCSNLCETYEEYKVNQTCRICYEIFSKLER